MTKQSGNNPGNPNKTQMISLVDLHSVAPKPAPEVVDPPLGHATLPGRAPFLGTKPAQALALPLPPPPLTERGPAFGTADATDPGITWSGGDRKNAPTGPAPDADAANNVDSDEDARDPGGTQRIPRQGARKLSSTTKVIGMAVGIIGALVAAVLVGTYLTGSKPTSVATKTAPTAPATPTGDEGKRALDLANSQGEAFNAFIAKIGPDLQGLDDRIKEAEKDKAEIAALRKEVAELKQIVVTLQQSAGAVEIGVTKEPDEDVEPPQELGVDHLVVEPAPKAPIDPTQLYDKE